MAMKEYRIVCGYDEQAKVWYVADSDVPGLAVEAPSKETMIERIRQAAPELLRLNAHLDDDQIRRAPLELIWANTTEKIRLAG